MRLIELFFFYSKIRGRYIFPQFHEKITIYRQPFVKPIGFRLCPNHFVNATKNAYNWTYRNRVDSSVSFL